MTKLEQYITESLQKVSKVETQETLGDRQKYIGSSDISGCLRKAYLDKLQAPTHDLSTLIKFERGHIAERIVKKMLSELKVQEQIEVSGETEGFPLKAHIDFLLENKREAVMIEVKTVSSPVEEPYGSWILQVQYQLYLLKQSRGDKPLRGFILAIDLNSGWLKSFFVEYNNTLAEMALGKARLLASAIKNGEEPVAEEQLYCSICPHKGTCPLMNKGAEEVQGDDAKKLFGDFIKLSASKKEIEKSYNSKKEEVEQFMRSNGIKKTKLEDSFVTLTSDTSYVSLDTKELQKDELYPALLEKYGKEVARKGYLMVK